MSDDIKENPARDPAPAVTRSIRLMDLLADADTPMTLTELANELGLAKSSTANLCMGLESAEMVEKVGRGYRLGRRTARLGGAFAVQFQQVREFYAACDASPVLRLELVQVAMLDGTDALYLARHEGTRRRLGTPLGSRLPAALSATGRALLMGLTDDGVTSLLHDKVPFPKLTEHSPTDLEALLARLAEARARGWALDSEESYPGVVGVAVPLEPWAPGDPQFALGAGIDVNLSTTSHIEQIAEALQDVARALTNPFSATAQRSRLQARGA